MHTIPEKERNMMKSECLGAWDLVYQEQWIPKDKNFFKK